MSIYRTDTKAIKKIMVDRNIESVTELSKKSGIGRNTLAKVLNGQAQPSSDTMEKLVYTLKIPPEKAGKIFFTHTLRVV